MILRFFIISVCLIFSTLLTAQVEITVDRPNAIYQVGEIIQFNVEGSGQASYRIMNDRFSNSSLQKDALDLHNWETNKIYFKATQPGMVSCTIYKNFQAYIASAVVEPFAIKTKMPPPTDLLDFWNNQLSELAAVPIDPQLNLVEETEFSETYRLSLATVNDRRVHGYISIPKAAGPFPAMLQLPPFGDNVNLANPIPEIAERGGMIGVNITIHNRRADQQDPNAYEPNIITNPDSLYYKLAVLAGVRVIDYIYSRTDFDGENMVVNGVSQGGGLSMIIGGLDQRVKAIAYSNSALCVHHGHRYDVASGFPYYFEQSKAQNGTQAHLDQTIEASQYVDAVYFAARFTGSSLGAIGYIDTICPANTVFTAYNALRGPKILYHAKKLDHSHPNDYRDGRMDMYRRLFPTMFNAPWPWPITTTGPFAEAGADQTTMVGQAISLVGVTGLENVPNTSWPVEWRVEEGTGAVSFSNSAGRLTTATFSAPGEYLIRFTAYDDARLDQPGDQATLVTLTDYVRVTVQ